MSACIARTHILTESAGIAVNFSLIVCHLYLFVSSNITTPLGEDRLHVLEVSSGACECTCMRTAKSATNGTINPYLQNKNGSMLAYYMAVMLLDF